MKPNPLNCLGLLLLPLSVYAMEPGPSSPYQQATEAWLQLQVKKQAASQIPQTASPGERELSLQRWMESFKHPIPEYYKEYSTGGKGN